MARRPGDPIPRPVLKWAGGKGQLLGELVPRVLAAEGVERYVEPFVGGGALFFELARLGRLPPRVLLADANPNLVEVYSAVRNELEALVELLAGLATRNTEAEFYAIRGAVPDTALARAARVIYLNKTCFNGLYRENSKGRFNVPFGRYTAPTILDERNLRAASAALAGVEVVTADFRSVLEGCGRSDFVYLDPPYVPLSASSSFTAYAKGGFGVADQARLARAAGEARARGARVLLSNSDAPAVHTLYEGWRISVVSATRSVNSKGDKRGAVGEVLAEG